MRWGSMVATNAKNVFCWGIFSVFQGSMSLFARSSRLIIGAVRSASNTARSQVFLDIKIGETPAGKITIEVSFSDCKAKYRY